MNAHWNASRRVIAILLVAMMALMPLCQALADVTTPTDLAIQETQSIPTPTELSDVAVSLEDAEVPSEDMVTSEDDTVLVTEETPSPEESPSAEEPLEDESTELSEEITEPEEISVSEKADSSTVAEDNTPSNAPTLMATSLPASITITIGERYEWQVASSDGQMTVSYRSDNTAVASVTSSALNYGYITGEGLGSTVVRAFEGTVQVATISVTVVSPATSVSLNYTSLTLGVGQSFSKLQATVLPATASQSVEYSSSNTAVASVNATYGTIVANSTGTAVITARASNGRSAACTVTVVQKPTGIVIDQSQVRLGVGMTTKLSATLTPSNIPEGIFFKSRNESIVTIDANGLITAVGEGETAIDVYTYLGISVSPLNVISVVVYPAPSSISFPSSKLYIGYNETYRLPLNYDSGSMADVSYTCSDSSRLQLTSYSSTEVIITGKAISSTPVRVTATAQNGVTTFIDVYVWGAPTQLTLPASSYTICVGDSIALAPILQSGKASGQLTVTSSVPTVATYADGKVKGVAIGSTTLTFTTYNGVSVSCAITVVAAPSAISLNVDTITLGVGMTYQLIPTVFPTTAATCTVTYTVANNNDVVSVDSNGKITAKSTGSAYIIAKTFNGKTTSCNITVLPAPDGIKLSSNNIVVGLGDNSQKINYQLTASDGGSCYGLVTFTSSDPSVLSVSDTGLITPIKTGTATVRLTATGGATADCLVTVVAMPTSLTLSPTTLTLGVGETRTLVATMLPTSGARVTYVSNNTAVATVDETSGQIQALTVGTATITATSYNGLQATCMVDVRPAPTSISLPEYSIQMAVGMRYTIQPTLSPSNAAGSITYTSSNFSAVSASVNGILVARAAGTAKITVQTYNGLPAAELYVNVVDAPSSFDLYVWGQRKTSIAIAIGESFQIVPTYADPDLHHATFTYSKAATSNCISLSSDGIVTGLSVGYTDVTVTMHTGLTQTLRVVVRPAATSMTMASTQLMGIGETRVIAATLAPTNSAGHILYSSSDPTVATVDEATGSVTALTQGQTTITATVGNLFAQCVVTVGTVPTSIFLPNLSTTLGVGMTFTLGASLQPETAGGIITYVSDNPTVASVSSAGVISALATGTAQIRVSTYNGKYNIFNVTVQPAPSSLSMSPSSGKLSIGDTMTVAGIAPEGTKGRLLYYSSNSNIATVDVYHGTVKAIAQGTVTITCKAHNGVEASMQLVVVPAPTGLTISPASLTIGVGDNSTLSVTQSPSTATANVVFSSSAPAVATVDASSGVVTAKSPGVTVITARTSSGLQTTATVTVVSAPTSVSFTQSEVTVGLGTRVTVPVSYTTGTATTLTYTSATNIYATVYANQGVIYGRMIGDEIITVHTHNGLTANILVHVVPSPDKLVLSATSLNVGMGSVGQITCSIANGVPTAYTVTAVDSSIVKPIITGNIVSLSPQKEGITVVEVKTANGLIARCQVTVTAAPTSVTLSATSLSLGLSDSKYLTATCQPNNAGGGITWSSNNPSVVSVDKNTGLVRGLTYGAAIITATTYNGKTATCTVTVYKDATSLSIPASMSMSVGEVYDFMPVFGAGEYSNVSYQSSNAAVAVVYTTGKMTAKGIGTTTITVKTTTGISATCTVTVVGAPTSISLSSTSVNLLVGNRTTLGYTLLPAGSAANVTFTSSNLSIAWVHPTSGIIIAYASGTATITATTSNGKKASCTVTVGQGPTSLTIYSQQGSSGAKIGIGQVFAIAWAASPAYSGISYSVTSSNPEVASIALYGERMNVTALKAGTTTLTIKASNGLSKTFPLTVYKEPTSLTLNRTSFNLSYLSSFQLSYLMGAGEEGAVTFSCDRPDLLTISSTGLLTPRGKPSRVVTVTVTATTYNGVSTTCKVNVVPW